MVYGLPAIGEATWGQKLNDSIEAIHDIAAEDSGWIAPTLLNSWVNSGLAGYADAGYRKIGNRVHLKGLLKDGGLGSPAFTLPAGHRPSSNKSMAGAQGTSFARVLVGSDGNVSINAASSLDVSIDGISFLVD